MYKRADFYNFVSIIFNTYVYLLFVLNVGTKDVLKNVNGIFAPNQLVAIMGPSGAGKSSLLDVISGYK